MAAAPLQGARPSASACHAARGEQRTALGIVEIRQRAHLQQRGPLRIVAPALVGRPAARTHRKPMLRQRRQELLAQPWLQRIEVLAAVDQQHAGVVVTAWAFEPERIDKAARAAID